MNLNILEHVTKKERPQTSEATSHFINWTQKVNNRSNMLSSFISMPIAKDQVNNNAFKFLVTNFNIRLPSNL